MNFLNSPIVRTAALLVLSNCFMIYAWYGHLKSLSGKPLWMAIIVSWSIAFIEYCIAVPANRIGHAGNLSLAQLKIMQEVITLAVFVPFSIIFMKQQLRWNFLFAGLCMVGAVYFIFRD